MQRCIKFDGLVPEKCAYLVTQPLRTPLCSLAMMLTAAYANGQRIPILYSPKATNEAYFKVKIKTSCSILLLTMRQPSSSLPQALPVYFVI